MLPVSKDIATRVPCKRRDLPVSTSEKSIFYYLGINHVFYKRELRWLYFSDIEQTPVLTVLDSLDTERRKDYVLETLYLDVHHYFFGGYRLKLPERLSKPLLVALRLKGVVISYDLAALPAAATSPDPDNLPG
ncbi:MAG: hypothetical protein R3F02_01095 [Thiolinea sp.]